MTSSMPLLEMSPNIQESEATCRKRSHDDFAGDVIKVGDAGEAKPPAVATIQPVGDCLLPPITKLGSQKSTEGSPGLTAESSTPNRKSPSPQTPTKTTETKTPATTMGAQSKSTPNPQAKRKRLTPTEKAARDKELADQKKEREEAKAAKAAEKARIEEEKAARAKEKAAEKAKADEERATKKRKKEEEQKRIQEQKDKKARSQPTLANFFGVNKTPKKPDTTSTNDQSTRDASPATPALKETKTEYEKLFKPFFVKEHTIMAPVGPQMDDETREVKSRILDECVSGKRADEVKGFDAMALFAFPTKPPKRGKLYHPVKHIMEQVYKETERSDTTDPDQARKIMGQAREKLSKIPMKVIAFSRDVRPPYCGTITFKSFALGKDNMSELARNPMRRQLPLDYDYDSEAEWQEEEEGEDLDMDDDEEELDDEDDMEEFLDDSEDAGLSRRIFANTLEPDSTGICFESDEQSAHNQIVYEHRMEFMHEGLEQSWGIDPFSTQYWEPDVKTKAAKTSSGPGSNMLPPPARAVNAFAALTGGPPSADVPKMVKAEILDDVKKAILDNAALSKLGIIDFVFHQFRDSVSRTEVKNTLEHVAEKRGPGRQKSWALKPGHEIVS